MNQSWFSLLIEITLAPHEESTTVPREILSRPELARLDRDFVLTIQGVRRCGKSTLLRQIASRAKVTSDVGGGEDPQKPGMSTAAV